MLIASSLICPVLLFYNAAPPTEIYTLSLHDALPIWEVLGEELDAGAGWKPRVEPGGLTERRRAATADPDRRATGTMRLRLHGDRKSTRLNSSHTVISYAVFCLKKKKNKKPKKMHI